MSIHACRSRYDVGVLKPFIIIDLLSFQTYKSHESDTQLRMQKISKGRNTITSTGSS